MNGKLIRLSIIGMTENSKYDAMGELFHRKLEHHQISVDENCWNEIERRLDKSKNKAVIWLWSGGAMAAAATIAAFLMIVKPATNEPATMIVAQQTTSKAPMTVSPEVVPADIMQKITDMAIIANEESEIKNEYIVISIDYIVTDTLNQEEIFIAITENNEQQPAEDMPALDIYEEAIHQLNIYLETMAETDKTAAKRDKKWLFAAAFGMGRADDFQNTQESSIPGGTQMAKDGDTKGVYSNSYATDMSLNIRSFDYLAKNDFTNVSHNPPLSFGLTARKSLGKKVGVETGLIYTNLASHFEWSEWSDYNVRQNLHYVGIPLNVAIYILDTSPNWRIYFSGGFTVEKGLRAIYRQEMRQGNAIQTATVKKSSIDGLQWSLNSALGVNYKIEKGWGIYFEPRVGYSFDCDQPASIRTESPVYFGINLGLSYEL